jgi:hypothetical protein
MLTKRDIIELDREIDSIYEQALICGCDGCNACLDREIHLTSIVKRLEVSLKVAEAYEKAQKRKHLRVVK